MIQLNDEDVREIHGFLAKHCCEFFGYQIPAIIKDKIPSDERVRELSQMMFDKLKEKQFKHI